MKKYFYLLVLAIFSTVCFISCSSSDDEDQGNGGGNSGYLIIDETKWTLNSFYGASYTSKENWALNFSAHLDEQGGDNRSRNLTFAVDGVSRWTNLKEGDIKIIDINFRPINDISVIKRYSIKEGKVKVVNLTSTSTTISFDNVVINNGNTTHKINGTLVYTDTNTK